MNAGKVCNPFWCFMKTTHQEEVITKIEKLAYFPPFSSLWPQELQTELVKGADQELLWHVFPQSLSQSDPSYLMHNSDDDHQVVSLP